MSTIVKPPLRLPLTMRTRETYTAVAPTYYPSNGFLTDKQVERAPKSEYLKRLEGSTAPRNDKKI